MAIKIALAGNPNCGKTTLFNALTGSNQFVGNWPGVTVEKKEGRLKNHQDIIIVDLPGIYSLSPYTLEEVVARNYLLEEKPDAIINIIDGTNIERNLYLSTQFMELGIPVIMAVNMIDILEKNGDKIDIAQLSRRLGCEVVEISALRGTGMENAAEKAVRLAQKGVSPAPVHRFSKKVEAAITAVEEKIGSAIPDIQKRFFAIKLLERDSRIAGKLSSTVHAADEISSLEQAFDDDIESIITNERYNYVTRVVRECLTRTQSKKHTTSDQIDRIVTNRWLALPIFAAIMALVYTVSISTVGGWASDWANNGVFGDGFSLFGSYIPGIPVIVENALESIHCAQWLSRLILDGIVAGVGAVLGFVPQMLVLFLFLAFLEACGYMSRVAFIMDRIFRNFGLSGKSFIPIMIGTGCGVPGIMASRTIESDRDRKMTIITTTFIPCGAKLPMISLIAGALFGGAGWVATSAYFVGMAAIICSGIILKKTKLFTGDPAPFVMELPAYHLPTAGNILRSMWERGWSFIKKAGTIILLSSIVIWFATYFGWVDGKFQLLDEMEVRYSILAKLGSFISWLFIPLGWGEWKAAVATITGLGAKENVVGTLGILHGFAEVSDGGGEIWAALQGSMSAVSAYSFMIFNLLCAPCAAAMGAIRREMNNKKWFWFALCYQTLFAYLTAMVVNQIGMLITVREFGIGTVAALAVIIVFIFLLVRRPQQKKRLPRINKKTSAVWH